MISSHVYNCPSLGRITGPGEWWDGADIKDFDPVVYMICDQQSVPVHVPTRFLVVLPDRGIAWLWDSCAWPRVEQDGG